MVTSAVTERSGVAKLPNMTATCPIHHEQTHERSPSAEGVPDGYAVLSCGYPALVCPHCHVPNPTVARFCRACRTRLCRPATERWRGQVVRGLARAVRESRKIEPFSLLLPDGAGAVSVLAEAWGFLFVGTHGGQVLVYNALAPGEVLARTIVGEPVVGIAPCPEPPASEETPAAPAMLVTTRTSVVRLLLLPDFTAEPLWLAGAGRLMAAPALPLEGGVLAFPAWEEKVEPVWLVSGRAAVQARSLEAVLRAPVGGPVRLGPGRSFFFDAEQGIVFDASRPDMLLSTALAHPPDPHYRATFDAELDEVFLVYVRKGQRGVARVSAGDLTSYRVTEPVYAAPQVAVVSSELIAVGSHNDLALLSPSGGRKWSLAKDHFIDTLAVNRFPPLHVDGHLVVYTQARSGVQALQLLALDEAGRRQGLLSLAQVGDLQVPLMVVSGGVVAAGTGRPGGGPELLVIRPPRS